MRSSDKICPREALSLTHQHKILPFFSIEKFQPSIDGFAKPLGPRMGRAFLVNNVLCQRFNSEDGFKSDEGDKFHPNRSLVDRS